MKEKNINIINKNICTGCMACFNACPKGAISIEKDKNGFYYPIINKEKCINCSLCLNVCPTLNYKKTNSTNPLVYALKASDDIRLKSSSGGAFGLFAKYFIKKGGCICAAMFNENWQLEHKIIDSEEELIKLQGAKYVQSNINDCYKKTQEILNANRPLLFCATPCQIAGLYSFLKKDYKNLFTIDLLCHGAPSVGVWEKYLNENYKEKEILSINFRDKEKLGWSCSKVVIKTKDGEFIDDKYTSLFHKNIINRFSCEKCNFSKYPRVADISLGDFWGINEYLPEMDDKKGVSLVFINSKKGEEIFNEIIKQSYEYKKITLKTDYNNGSLIKNHGSHNLKKRFFEIFQNNSFNETLNETFNFDIGLMGLWFGENFGSILTYYALYETLVSMGKSVLMIENPILTKESLENIFEKKQYKFAKENYNISELYNYKDLNKLNKICKNFILGSDQIWNPNIYKKYKDSFFFDFVDNNKRKIAYACSFGKEKINFNFFEKIKIKYYLKKFSAISLRERESINFLKKEFNLSAQNMLDPVFLCDKKNFEKIANQNIAEKNYIFSYILDPDLNKKELIKKIKEKLNKKTITTSDNARNPKINEKLLQGLENIKIDIEVQDFLAYYKNADFIITDSFHGTCFAIIFKKPFIALLNNQRGAIRFESLLETLNLKERLFSDAIFATNSEIIDKPIDYDKVEEILNNKKQESINWLKNAIEKPNTIYKESFFDSLIGKILFFYNSSFKELSKEFSLCFDLYINQNKKIMFWGASTFLKNFIKKYNIKNKNIIGIIDKNKNLLNKTMEGYKIFSPDEIKNLKPQRIIITIPNHPKIYNSIKDEIKRINKNITVARNFFEN